MTLNQILYFRKVARLENYHQAAEELYISQPSLSRSMAALESELGITLFEKKGRGVVLTNAGRLFLEHADRIAGDCDIAAGKMKELASGGGKINIGYIFPLAGHYIPHNVRTFLDQEENKNVAFSFWQNHTPAIAQKVKSGHNVRTFLDKEENKNVAFSFWQNHTPAIAQKVKSGELDLGFGGFLKRDDMEFFPLIQQPLVIVSPEQHPIADEPEVPLVKLTRYPVIGYDRASWMGAYTGHLYRKYQLHPNIIMECPDEYSIVALVRENFGIALMPRTDILEQADGIRIHTLKGLEIYHQTFMFWMKNRYRLPAVERFTEYMKQHADIIEESRNDSENVSKVYLKDIVNF